MSAILLATIAAAIIDPIWAGYTIQKWDSCVCEYGFETVTFTYQAEDCCQDEYCNYKACKEDSSLHKLNGGISFEAGYTNFIGGTPHVLVEGVDLQKGNSLKNKVVIGEDFGCVPLFLYLNIRNRDDGFLQQVDLATNQCVQQSDFVIDDGATTTTTTNNIGGLLIENAYNGAFKFVDWTCREAPLFTPEGYSAGLPESLQSAAACTELHTNCHDQEEKFQHRMKNMKDCAWLAKLADNDFDIHTLCRSKTTTSSGESVLLQDHCKVTCGRAGWGECKYIKKEEN